MDEPTTSHLWPLYPGDWVIAELEGTVLRILRRTPNDIECQDLLKAFIGQGREVFLLQAKGKIT